MRSLCTTIIGSAREGVSKNCSPLTYYQAQLFTCSHLTAYKVILKLKLDCIRVSKKKYRIFPAERTHGV